MCNRRGLRLLFSRHASLGCFINVTVQRQEIKKLARSQSYKRQGQNDSGEGALVQTPGEGRVRRKTLLPSEPLMALLKSNAFCTMVLQVLKKNTRCFGGFSMVLEIFVCLFDVFGILWLPCFSASLFNNIYSTLFEREQKLCFPGWS